MFLVVMILRISSAALAEMVTGFIGENIVEIRVDGLKLSKFQTQKEPE